MKLFFDIVIVSTCIAVVRALNCLSCSANSGFCSLSESTCKSGTTSCQTISSTSIVEGQTNSRIKQQCRSSLEDFSFNSGVVFISRRSSFCQNDHCNDQIVAEPANTTLNGLECFGCYSNSSESCSSNSQQRVKCMGAESRCMEGAGLQLLLPIGLNFITEGCVSENICRMLNLAEFSIRLNTLECCEGNLCNSVVSTSTGSMTSVMTTKSSLTPAVNNTLAPSATSTSAPAATSPSAPAATSPSAPAATSPSAPAATSPSAPAATSPSAPAATSPSAPAATSPSAPAATSPSAPAATSPSAPAATSPSAPAATSASAAVPTGTPSPLATKPSTPIATSTFVPAANSTSKRVARNNSTPAATSISATRTQNTATRNLSDPDSCNKTCQKDNGRSKQIWYMWIEIDLNQGCIFIITIVLIIPTMSMSALCYVWNTIGHPCKCNCYGVVVEEDSQLEPLNEQSDATKCFPVGLLQIRQITKEPDCAALP
ncbi:uncharacterized protein YMR317W-like isoform X2 [Carcharodon carcharias]|uniref:uncharacterized protein YMR317W-like isoform X2 n=1 Tax=Carcharodon carcharias TaxID=13397 RepID=UPI001B7DA5CF|nr:uncharacterized protein YMR317W-like isoform X2 [Carcharodon carcharias]